MLVPGFVVLIVDLALLVPPARRRTARAANNVNVDRTPGDQSRHRGDGVGG